MKKILFIIALAISFGVKAQIYTPLNQTTYGQHNLRGKFDSVLHVPRVNDTLLHTTDTSVQIRVINGRFMIHLDYWREVAIGSSANWDSAYARNLQSFTVTSGVLYANLLSGQKLAVLDTTALMSHYVLTDGTRATGSWNINAATVTNGVYTTRTLTINGSAQTLASDRTWTITTTGTSNRITVSGGAGTTPTIDIASTYVGQTSITTLGTIATGVWNGTAIGDSYISSASTWNTAYSERRQWDGGNTNLVAATGRTSLGGTTVGQNFFTLTNPSAITFPRINADNTVSALDAATFRTAIGAGTGSGTVTSVAMTVPTGLSISGSPVTSSGTLAVSFTSGYSIPTDANQTNWTAGYNDKINSITFSASTLTLTQQDGGTVTQSVPTFNQNTTGNAATATLASNSTLWNSQVYNGTNPGDLWDGFLMRSINDGKWYRGTLADMIGTAPSLNIGGNAATSSAVTGPVYLNSTNSIRGNTTHGVLMYSNDLASTNMRLTDGGGDLFVRGQVYVGGNGYNTGSQLLTQSSASSTYLPVSGGSSSPMTGILYTKGSALVLRNDASGSGTSSAYAYFSSTGGEMLWGQDQSTGGNLFTGSSAYAAVFGHTGNRATEFATNNTIRYSISGAGNHDFKSGSITTNGDIQSNSIFRGAGGVALIQGGATYQDIGSISDSRTVRIYSGTVLAATFNTSGNTLLSGSVGVGGATTLTGIQNGVWVSGSSSSGFVSQISGSNKAFFYADASNLYIEAASGLPQKFVTNGTIALTLATNQVATFASIVNATGAYYVNSASQSSFITNYTGTGALSMNFTSFNNTGAIYDETNARYIMRYTPSSNTLTFSQATTFSSTVTATAFYESSDLRYKNVLQRTSSEDGFDMIAFKWKNGLKRDNLVHYGYVAQEVFKVLPGQVQTDEKGFMSVNYIDVLVYKISKLEERIKKLENK